MNRKLGRLALGLVMVAYALIAHQSNLLAIGHSAGLAIALAPVFIFGVIVSWRTHYRIPCLLLFLLSSGLLAQHWSELSKYSAWVYFIQQDVAYVCLGGLFGRSLLKGHVPLCTHWAELVHGPLSIDTLRYTRTVTLVWTIFFANMTLLLIAMFLFASLPIWSFFANFCTLPLVATLFIVEYWVRNRVLPDMQHASIFEGIRAFLLASKAQSVPR